MCVCGLQISLPPPPACQPACLCLPLPVPGSLPGQPTLPKVFLSLSDTHTHTFSISHLSLSLSCGSRRPSTVLCGVHTLLHPSRLPLSSRSSIWLVRPNPPGGKRAGSQPSLGSDLVWSGLPEIATVIFTFPLQLSSRPSCRRPRVPPLLTITSAHTLGSEIRSSCLSVLCLVLPCLPTY